MQADAVVLNANRHVWCGKQPTLLDFIEQQVEGIDGQLGIAWHVGQFGMHLAQHEDGFACSAALGDHRQQVEGDVWVAGQAQVHGLFGVAATNWAIRFRPLALISRAAWL